MNKGRFESFSDAVFAFALTLLVLGFVVPMNGPRRWTDEGNLTHALLRLWPNLIAYVLSFAVIGIMWQNHHALLRAVKSVDRLTVFLNLLLLGCTAFIPFASATLGSYPTTHAATFLYGVVLTSCATCFNLMLNQLVRKGGLGESLRPETITSTLRAYRTGWILYAVATAVALVSPVVSFALYIIVVGYYLVPRGVDDDLGSDGAQARPN